MSDSIPIPMWAIYLFIFFWWLTWLIATHGREPFAEDQKPFDHLMDTVGKPYVLIMFIIASGLFITALVFYLWDIMVSVRYMVKSLRSEALSDTINSETLRNLAQSSALLLGALVAASTLVFTVIKVWINERTTTATEEGLITDRINAAVASLGAEKTQKDAKTGNEFTFPNIEVRIGAILALERIAKMNADVHIQIMEILTAYLRENAPIKDQENSEKPRQDIQLALTVIGRRPAKRITLERQQKFRLDLRRCDFSLADISETNFDHAQFTASRFVRADLSYAQLNNANLWYAQLNDARLFLAQLNNANLEHAQLNNARLNLAQLNNADLRNAQINFVIFSSFALRGACVQNFDFSTIIDPILSVTQEQIDTMFGDASVILPAHITRPAHWPRETRPYDFFGQWLAWQETLD